MFATNIKYGNYGQRKETGLSCLSPLRLDLPILGIKRTERRLFNKICAAGANSLVLKRPGIVANPAYALAGGLHAV